MIQPGGARPPEGRWSVYTYASDRALGLMVGVWSGTSNVPQDFDVCIESLKNADRDGMARREPVATIIVSDRETPTPSAVERKRIADVWSAARSPHVFALVSTSPLVRGVMTAINWFAPPTHERPQSFHATFDEALAWIEQRRPGTSERMRELYREARSAADAKRKAG